MSSLDQVTDTVSQALRENPYTNFGKMYITEGLEFPDAYGGNCIEMARRWTQRLDTFDGESQYLLAHILEQEEDDEYGIYEETYHHAMLKCIDGEWYFFDPVILLNKPIPIEKILKSNKPYGESGYVFDAYPVVDGKPTHVIVKPITDTTFSIRVERPKKHGYKVLFENYYFINEMVDELPPSDDLEIATTNGNYYYIRFMGEETGSVLLAFDSTTKKTILCQEGDGVTWKTWILEKEPDAFTKNLYWLLPEDIDPQDLLQKLWFCPTLHERLSRDYTEESL